MSLWEDCKPWVPRKIAPPVKRVVTKRRAPAPLPKFHPVQPPRLDYRPGTGEAPELYRDKPRPATRQLTRIGGRNAKTRACGATVEQIDMALARRDLGYKDMAALLGEPVTRAMVRHWRAGILPRMYLRAKGLVLA